MELELPSVHVGYILRAQHSKGEKIVKFLYKNVSPLYQKCTLRVVFHFLIFQILFFAGVNIFAINTSKSFQIIFLRDEFEAFFMTYYPHNILRFFLGGGMES